MGFFDGDGQHSFGGRAFDRYLYEFEVPEDTGGDAPAPDPVEPAAEAEPAAEWTGPSQEEWQNLTQFQQQVTPFLSELAGVLSAPPESFVAPGQEQPEEPQLPDFDPFDPQFGQNMSQYMQGQIQDGIRSGIEEALGPFQGLLGMLASEKGEGLARAELETIQKEVGEFDSDTAFLVANGLIEQGNDPSVSLRRSAEYVHAYEDRIGKRAVENYLAGLGQLSSGQGDVPTGGPHADVNEPVGPVRGGSEKYRVAVTNALARRRPVTPDQLVG